MVGRKGSPMSIATRRGRETASYTDLRDWLRAVDEMGEVRYVKGASWEEDIGRISEMLHHTEESPAVLFDAIPGYPRGFRVLVNPLGARRRLAFTLGMDPQLSTPQLIDAWEERLGQLDPVQVEAGIVGPILEDVMAGDRLDLVKLLAPRWHRREG